MDDAQRAALATRHIDLPRRAAACIHRRVREHIELDELVALGNLGLAEAASRYDPAANSNFRSYAWYRVQGAIFDGIRRNTTLPRRVWAQINALSATSEYLQVAHERAGAARDRAGDSTTADRLGEVNTALGAIRTMFVVSIERVAEEEFSSSNESADGKLMRKQRTARISAAMSQLPERERALVTAHYGGGQTLLDAGQAIGMSKSWASRLHARAIDRLRKLLAGDEEP